ncbi:MAG: hypothetical protein BHW12_07690 [Coprobacillus sp. 28_7]|nr:MAG: hypothetical protein BHW12_07690 [Coprobacillus sp. 28_7]
MFGKPAIAFKSSFVVNTPSIRPALTSNLLFAFKKSNTTFAALPASLEKTTALGPANVSWIPSYPNLSAARRKMLFLITFKSAPAL